MLQLILYILASPLIYIFLKIVLIPAYRVFRYRGKGALLNFTPILGENLRYFRSVKKRDDYYFYQKRFRKGDKPYRYIASPFGTQPYVALVDPQLIKAFYNSQQYYIKKKTSMGFLSDLVGEGLLLAEGDSHKTQRKIISTVFHFGLVKDMIQVISKTSDEHLRNLDISQEINILQLFQKITGEIVGRIFFGEELGQHQFEGKSMMQALEELLQDNFKLAYKPQTLIFGQHFMKRFENNDYHKIWNRVQKFRQKSLEIVNEKMEKCKRNHQILENKENKDLLERLYFFQCENPGSVITNENIVDQFVTFFLAGMDTTAHLILMSVYNSIKYSYETAKLAPEIKRYKEANGEIDYVLIQSLNNTHAFVKETLRFNSIVPALFPRIAVQDHYLGDLLIRKDSWVNVYIVTNNNSDEFFDDSLNFRPERFLEEKPLKDPFAFIPFSAGNRNCIGQQLAMLETKVIFMDLLSKFDLSMNPMYKARISLKFLPEPVDPIMLRLSKKRSYS